MKFKNRGDVVDIGPLEAAYADMARAAGIAIPPTTLIAATGGPGYFATKRFDRGPDNARHHVLSVAAILETDWSIPAIDYSSLHNLVRRVTGSQIAVEQMFRRMTFNVLAHNRDDHTKQHAFIMARDGEWDLAPAYDLTLSHGPGGEHYLTVKNKGTAITDNDLFAVAREVHIRPARAREIIGQVMAAIVDFPNFASMYGVRKSTTGAFRKTLRPGRIDPLSWAAHPWAVGATRREAPHTDASRVFRLTVEEDDNRLAGLKNDPSLAPRDGGSQTNVCTTPGDGALGA